VRKGSCAKVVQSSTMTPGLALTGGDVSYDAGCCAGTPFVPPPPHALNKSTPQKARPRTVTTCSPNLKDHGILSAT
jgi:hypothetical protein